VNSYELFGKFATVSWFLVGLGVAALVLVRAKRTPQRVCFAIALAGLATWLLTNSFFEQWLWLRFWPKSRMERIHAEACQIMWQERRFSGMTPDELEPELTVAMLEVLRRVDAETLLEHAKFMTALAALEDKRLCNALGKTDPHSMAVVWDSVERVSELDYERLRRTMLAGRVFVAMS
jgi:hypothetical protein